MPKHQDRPSTQKAVTEVAPDMPEEQSAFDDAAPEVVAEVMADMSKLAEAVDLPIVAIVAEAAPKSKATKSGHTLCRVTGTAVMYHGQYFSEGVVDEFEDAVVLDMPSVFVSVE